MFESVLNILLTASGPLLLYFVKRLVERWIIDNKIKLENAAIRGKFSDFTKAALKAVTQIDFEYSQPLKKSGEFGPVQEAIAKEKAMELYKSYYGSQGLVDMALFFQCNAAELDAIMQLKIEAAVYTYRHPHKKPGSIIVKDDEITFPKI